MSCDEPVTRWLRKLEDGDSEAARLLCQRYYQELVDLAKARLGTTPRRVTDEEDIAQIVLQCLFEGATHGRYATVVNRQELWRLLATITGRKVVEQQRRFNKQKRGGGRVRGDSVMQGSDGELIGAGFDRFPGDAPTPAVLAIAKEEYDRLMARLDDAHLREIALCKLEGYTNDEIGQRLGLTRRSIERKLQRIRQIWERELNANDPIA